jgi:PAS domain-containing protein
VRAPRSRRPLSPSPRAPDNTARQQVEAEKKKLDQRLRDQQFYPRSLIESNIDALMTTDPSGIITDVNNQMEALSIRS